MAGLPEKDEDYEIDVDSSPEYGGHYPDPEVPDYPLRPTNPIGPDSETGSSMNVYIIIGGTAGIIALLLLIIGIIFWMKRKQRTNSEGGRRLESDKEDLDNQEQVSQLNKV